MFLKYLIDNVQWMFSMILNVHVCMKTVVQGWATGSIVCGFVANGANKGPLLLSLLNELWGKGPHQ